MPAASQGFLYLPFCNSYFITFQSGTLRMISKPGILDSLFQYEHNNRLNLNMEADHYYFSKLLWEGISRLIEVTYTVNSFDSTGFNAEVYGVYKVPGGKIHSFEYDKKTALKNILTPAC